MAATAQPPYGGTLLYNGSTGPDVALVQRWLNGLHSRWPAIPLLKVDGEYGPKTTAAVKMFQALTALNSDGTVGPQTWNRLYAEYAADHGAGEIYPGIPMQSGNRGATVKSAQQRLQQLIPALVADGKFGPKTKQAVIAYQTMNSLNVDGIIGTETWQSLYT